MPRMTGIVIMDGGCFRKQCLTYHAAKMRVELTTYLHSYSTMQSVLVSSKVTTGLTTLGSCKHEESALLKARERKESAQKKNEENTVIIKPCHYIKISVTCFQLLSSLGVMSCILSCRRVSEIASDTVRHWDAAAVSLSSRRNVPINGVGRGEAEDERPQGYHGDAEDDHPMPAG